VHIGFGYINCAPFGLFWSESYLLLDLNLNAVDRGGMRELEFPGGRTGVRGRV
jgi:hypothetical protein